jgi:hypothetical protein
MPVTDLGDTDGWTAEPVDHDPFASDADSFANSVARNNPPNPQGLGGITGHIAATSDPSHPLTSRSLPFAGSQSSAEPYQPGPGQRIQQGVSEAAQNYGVPTQGAERIGSTAQFGAQAVPFVGQAISGAEAIHSAQQGDFPGTVANLAGVTPMSAVIAGPLARIADKAALAEAERMTARGAPVNDIYDATKWMQNPAKQWGFEIPDTGAAYQEDLSATKLGHVLDAPGAYEAYPGLKDIPLEYMKPGETRYRGSFWPDRQAPGSVWTPPGRMMLARGLEGPSVPLHELQHGIQASETFPGGGIPKKPFETNPNFSIWDGHFQANLDKLMNDPPKNAVEYQKFMRIPDPTAAEFEFEDFKNARAASMRLFGGKPSPNMTSYASSKANHDYYLSHFGEAEARNVQRRYAEAQKQGGYQNLARPYETFDVPNNEFSLPPYADGGRISMADGGAPDDLSAFGQMKLEPVDGDPFAGSAPQPVDFDKAYAKARWGIEDQRAPANTPEEIDQPGPMTETLAHYAANPEHAMPMRIGAAIGEEGKRIGEGLWSAATAPGDVLTGKASMADPETQQRAIGLTAFLQGGGPEAALGARGPVSAAARAARQRALGREAPEVTTAYEPPWAGEPAATTTVDPAQALPNRPLNRWNAETGQWEGPKPKMNPPEGVTYPDLFNLDPEVMKQVPDVPQFDLPRYNPPRGVSERMRDLVTNPDVRQQMLQIVRNGMQTVGLSWYNTGQLRGMFLKELGDEQGQRAFEQYMNLVSATSPENKIPQNIRTASYFHERQEQGVPPPERGDPIAQPYGSKAQKLHQQNVNNVLTEGYDVLKNPKPPSFVQNLMGNYAPGTMDRHAFKLPAMLSKDPRFLETSFTPEKGAEPVRPQQMFQNGDLTMEDAVNQPTMWAGMPNKNEYAALEGYYKSIADELGITPAQVQASAWVGGGNVTGLASASDETFLHSFQGRVFNTAYHTGQTPAEVVRRMIRGEQPLLVGGPGMAPLLQQEQARKEAQTSTAEPGGAPPPPVGRERERPLVD